MRVGIVGGTGNISTSVVRLLLERGHDVTCITRGASGRIPEGARHLAGDRNDFDWFVPAVQRERFDAAIDFIAFTPAHGAASLEAFRDVGHFVHTSTVTTVGENWIGCRSLKTIPCVLRLRTPSTRPRSIAATRWLTPRPASR